MQICALSTYDDFVLEMSGIFLWKIWFQVGMQSVLRAGQASKSQGQKPAYNI